MNFDFISSHWRSELIRLVVVQDGVFKDMAANQCGVQVKSYLLQEFNLQDENFPVIGLGCLIQTQDVCFDILFGGFCNKKVGREEFLLQTQEYSTRTGRY